MTPSRHAQDDTQKHMLTGAEKSLQHKQAWQRSHTITQACTRVYTNAPVILGDKWHISIMVTALKCIKQTRLGKEPPRVGIWKQTSVCAMLWRECNSLYK